MQSSYVHVLLAFGRIHLLIYLTYLQVRQVDSYESTTSHASDQQSRDVAATFRRPFADCFFDTLPLVVHPVIVLRLLCHKMFGDVVPRQENTPPK